MALTSYFCGKGQFSSSAFFMTLSKSCEAAQKGFKGFPGVKRSPKLLNIIVTSIEIPNRIFHSTALPHMSFVNYVSISLNLDDCFLD